MIIESLKPPFKIYNRQIVKVNPEVINNGVLEIKLSKKEIAVISAIKKNY